MEILSKLPHTQIYYVAVGSAEGTYITKSDELNQQLPQFLDKYPKLSKTMVLIDEAIQTPSYAETHIKNKNILQHTVEDKITYITYQEQDSDVISNLIIIRDNTLITITNDGFYSEKTIIFISEILSFCINANALLFYHDFVGHYLTGLYDIYDDFELNDQVMFSITNRSEDGCFSKFNALSDICIDEETLTIHNPWIYPVHELKNQYYRTDVPISYKAQVVHRIMQHMKKLKDFGWSIDRLYDTELSACFASCLPPVTEQAKQDDYNKFCAKYKELHQLLPDSSELWLADKYELLSDKLYVYCNKLDAIIKIIYTEPSLDPAE